MNKASFFRWCFLYVMILTINKKKYTVKYTIRALFIFEQITGKPFEIKTLLDNYILFYSLILANNPDNIIEWDEFIDALDNDKKLISQLNMFMTEQEKKNNILNSEDIKEEDSKKN